MIEKIRPLVRQVLPQNIKVELAKYVWMPNYLSASSRALPDFLIIGTQKGGTTSLMDYMALHPRVKMGIRKEVHYFDSNYGRGEKWYRSHFAKLNKLEKRDLVGEASPPYMFHPHVPSRIYSLLPDIKLILLLRDPVERAISHYYHVKRRGKESLDVFPAMQKESSRLSRGWQSMIADPNYFSKEVMTYSYALRGHYWEQIERLYKYFSKDQVLILFSEDLFEDPRKVTEKALNFLGASNLDKVPLDGLKARNKGLNKRTIEEKEAREFLAEYFDEMNVQLFDNLKVERRW